MRANEFITEVFQSGKQNWKWKRRTDDEAIATFTAGGRTYEWIALSHFRVDEPTKWEIQFRLIREQDDPDDLDLFGTTGTGNSVEVMSTAVDITREFLKEYGDRVTEITFNAKENSRIALYAKMINRLIPDWELSQQYNRTLGLAFTLTNPKAQEVTHESGVSAGGASHKWTGNEPYRHLVEKDVDEDMSRRGFLGALGGAAAAMTGLDAEAGTKKPKTKSPSQQTIQQVQKQQSVKQASPSKDPQAEAMLYKTAKASGMRGNELAQFLAQTKHESWNHSRLQEKPVGDPEKYFAKKYDPTLAPKTAKILGNKLRGDGAKYHGRGFIQLTGRDNYRMASEALGLDLLNRPDLASQPAVAAKIALWYWDTRVKPKVKNFEDTVAVTKTINNAMFGLEDRLANFIDYKKRIA